MNYDKITDPISPDAPCGADLLLEDDPDFLDYFFEAPERMPTKYYDLVREVLFDPKSIDFKGEEKQIEGLLKRTRDLRLLGIQARFQILAGRLDGFCDAFIAMADLLEAHPVDAHPQVNGDNNERRNALEELNTLATVTMPLQYATLVEDRRSGAVNQRMYLLATGQVEPREDEEAGDAGTLLSALSNEANQKDVDKTHEKLDAARAAVGRIIGVTKAQEDSPFTPDIEKLEGRLGELLDLIVQARPDLGGSSAEGDAVPDGEEVLAGDDCRWRGRCRRVRRARAGFNPIWASRYPDPFRRACRVGSGRAIFRNKRAISSSPSFGDAGAVAYWQAVGRGARYVAAGSLWSGKNRLRRGDRFRHLHGPAAHAIE